MNMDIENDLPLKPYLLGDLNPDEQYRIEQRLMIDAAAFEELGWVEDELIDDYLEGALSVREREKFESYFLAAPERQKKLSFAKSLKRYVAVHRPKENRLSVLWNSFQALWRIPSPVLRWAPAVSLLLVMAIGSWSVVRISGLRNTLAEVTARESQNQVAMQNRNSELAMDLQHEQARSRQLEQEAADLRRLDDRGSSSLLAGQLPATLAAIVLAPGRQRDFGSGVKADIPPGTDVVRLSLEIEPQDYGQYQATLQLADEGGTILTQTFSKTKYGEQGTFLPMVVSASELKRGDYIVKLRGITAAGDFEDINTYYFRVNLK